MVVAPDKAPFVIAQALEREARERRLREIEAARAVGAQKVRELSVLLRR